MSPDGTHVKRGRAVSLNAGSQQNLRWQWKFVIRLSFEKRTPAMDRGTLAMAVLGLGIVLTLLWTAGIVVAVQSLL